MPFLIPIFIGLAAIGAGAAGFGVAFGLSSAMLIVFGATMVLNGVASLLIRPSSVSSLTNDLQNRKVTIKQSVAPRLLIYGRAVTGGVWTYCATTGTKNEYLHLVGTFSGRRIAAVDAILLDQYTCSFDLAGNENGKYAGFLSVEIKLGHPGEAAFPGLIADTASLAVGGGRWTSNHRQDGCCSIHFKFKFDSSLFPNGVPAVRVKVRGHDDVYDPRTGLTGYTENTALCIRDYLTNTQYGLRAPASEMNDTLAIAAANLADEPVTLAAGNAAFPGSTEPRYTCNGVTDTSKSPADILNGMLSSGAGRIGWIGGQWCLYLGAWRPPSLSIGSSSLRGDLQVTGRVSRRDLVNAVKGVFVNPGADWVADAFPAVVNAAYVADDSGTTGAINAGYWLSGAAYIATNAVMNRGNAYVCTTPHTASAANEPGNGASWQTYWALQGEINWKEIELPFTISPATSQRLGKIMLEAGRRQVTAVAPCKLGVYAAQPPEVVQISDAAFGWSNKTFEIGQAMLAVEADGALGVDLNLSETDANVYSWSTADERTSSTPATVSVADPSTVGTVANVIVQSGPAIAIKGADGVTRARALVTWDSPNDQYVLSGGKIFVEYKLHSSATWLAGDELDGATQQTYLNGVVDGLAYDFRLRCRNSRDVFGAWVEVDNLTISIAKSTIVQEALTGVSIGNRNSAIVGGVSPLSATDTGSAVRIDVASFQMQFGFGRVSFNSGSITGLSYNTTYYVYEDDTAPPAGGSVAYHATSVFDVIVAQENRLYVGAILTPLSGGVPTGGGGMGGGCSCIDQYVDGATTIEQVGDGSEVEIHLGNGQTKMHAIAKTWPVVLAPCVELEFENGAKWRGSWETPICPRNGPRTYAIAADGAELLTKIRGKREFSRVAAVRQIGMRKVRMIYVDNQEFLSGCTPEMLVSTHNSGGGNPK